MLASNDAWHTTISIVVAENLENPEIRLRSIETGSIDLENDPFDSLLELVLR